MPFRIDPWEVGLYLLLLLIATIVVAVRHRLKTTVTLNFTNMVEHPHIVALKKVLLGRTTGIP